MRGTGLRARGTGALSMPPGKACPDAAIATRLRGRVNSSQRGRVMKRDLYEDVSRRIVAELEAGAAPWIKPWSASPGGNTPGNAATNRPYSGCNVVLLWMAQTAGYHAALSGLQAGAGVGRHGPQGRAWH